MIETIVFDVGKTITRDDRYWQSWADWLDVPRHTLSALVGAVVARGQDNAEALRLVLPGVDVAAEYRAREAAGQGEYLDESDLYDDVRSPLSALRELGVRVIVAGNQTPRADELLRALDLPVDLVVTSGEWGVAKPQLGFIERVLVSAAALRVPVGCTCFSMSVRWARAAAYSSGCAVRTETVGGVPDTSLPNCQVA